MKVESGNIQLSNQYQLQKQQQSSASLRYWKTPQPSRDQIALSQTAQSLQPEKTSLNTTISLNPNQSLMVSIIKRLYKEITGEELKLFSPDQINSNQKNTDNTNIIYQEPPAAISSRPTSNLPGFGMVYQQTDTYSESESSTFIANGIIKTQDGQELNFTASLNMSRAFQTSSQLSITAGEPEKKDPLVINFNGKAAELSNTRFNFDIDSNGSLDQINVLKPDSGYLALDKNNDGVINDGSELFGAKTGQGFAELATYDQDNNNFIDENDAIYQKLRIWQRHEDGSQQLLALGDKNIGAIFLGHVTTPFQLKNAENKTLGDVTSSGVYLTEQGQVGTVQQIDLSV
jgi:hypothetical protein